MFRFQLFRVRGRSMEPILTDGDLLLLRKRTARFGNIVVVDHPRYGQIVKRIDRNNRLCGDNPDSTPAEALGPYNPDHLIGVAIIAITPSGLRWLSARQSETPA